MYVALGTWQLKRDLGPYWGGPGDPFACLDLRPLSGLDGAGPGLFLYDSDPSALDGIHVLLGDDPEGVVAQAKRTALGERLKLATTKQRLDALLFELFTDHADAAGARAWRPIIPGSKDKRLKLCFGPILKAEAFDIRDHPFKGKVIDALAHDYAELRSKDLARGSDHYRRDLGAMVEKFRGLDYRLVQKALPDEEPLEPSTVHTESFNTANQEDLGPDLNWSDVYGDHDVVSNKSQSAASGHCIARADHDVSSADHYSQANVWKLSGDAGVALQMNTSTQSYTFVNGSSFRLWFYKWPQNSSLGFVSYGTVSGALMRFERDGTSLEGFVGGSSKLSTTDTSYTANRRGGVRAYNSGSQHDNFEVGDLVSVTTGTGAATIGAVEQSGSGTQIFIATSAQEIGAIEQSGSGAEVLAGTGAQEVGAIDQAAVGFMGLTGAGVQQVGPIDQAGAGESTAGTGAQTVGPIEQDGAGSERLIGAGVQQVGAIDQAASGGTGQAGSGAQTVGAISQAASGIQRFIAAAASQIGALIQSGGDKGKTKISEDFRRAAYAENTDEVFIVLLTIEHDDLVAPIRVSSDAVDTPSRNQTFTAYPFEVTLPDAREGALPRAFLRIDNVDRQIVEAIRAISEAVTVTIEIVLASDPDFVEVCYPGFRLRKVAWDAFVIEGELTLRHKADEPYPANRFTPSAYPGLFA